MPIRMRTGLGALVALAVLLAPAAAWAGEGDVLVRFRADASGSERTDARLTADVRREEALPVAQLELVDPEPGVSSGEAIRALERDDDVLYAEPDVPRRAMARPDDTYFGAQWALENLGQTVGGSSGPADADVDATEAWDITTGSPSVVLAVVDSGIDSAHPDLAPNLFVNGREAPGNGVDDDRNGFVDDVSGWDFVEGDAVPEDAEGHGTHVAGTAAARGGDGFGVTGVAWRTSVLPLRVLGDDGSGTVGAAIRAYAYAAAAGARIVNLSLGGGQTSRAERDALAAVPGVLFVAAAGNEGADNDVTPSYPCNHELPNVVCVGASDRADSLASFSNRGARTVDLAAPGTDIAGPYPGNDFALLEGTSMATPIVSGTAALLAAYQPSASIATLRRALLETVDPVPSLAGRTVTGGRLNAAAALGAIGAAVTVRGGEEPSPAQPSPAPAQPAPQPSSPAPSQPPPAAASTAVRDRSAPILRVSTSRVRGGRLRVRIRCSERCALSVSLRRGVRTVAKRSVTKKTPGTITVTLRPASRHARARLSLRVTATDPARNRRTVTRAVRVSR